MAVVVITVARTMTPAILVLNAGSSTVKFSLHPAESSGDARALRRGEIDGIGHRLRLSMQAGSKETAAPTDIPGPATHVRAFEYLLDWIGRGGEALDLAAAGHRIVHGGEAFADPIVVTPDVVRHCRISMRVDKFDISLANRFCSRARAAVDADDGPRAEVPAIPGAFSARPSRQGRANDGGRVRRRRRKLPIAGCSCAGSDAGRAASSFPGACDFRGSRPGRRLPLPAGACATSTILLVALVGRILRDISLAPLLAQIFHGRFVSAGIGGRARRTAGAFVALVLRRDRRRFCGHSVLLVRVRQAATCRCGNCGDTLTDKPSRGDLVPVPVGAASPRMRFGRHTASEPGIANVARHVAASELIAKIRGGFAGGQNWIRYGPF